MSWTGYAKCMGDDCIQGFLWVNHKERDHWEDLNVDGKIILKWILER
jgi:hypothetical protein